MHTTTNTRQYGLFVAQSPTGRVVNVRRPVTPAPAPRAVEPYQIPVAPAGDWVPYGTPAANATAPTAPAGDWVPYGTPAANATAPTAPAGDWVPYGTPAANATAPTAPAGPLPGYLGDDGGEWEPYLGPAS